MSKLMKALVDPLALITSRQLWPRCARCSKTVDMLDIYNDPSDETVVISAHCHERVETVKISVELLREATATGFADAFVESEGKPADIVARSMAKRRTRTPW